MVPRAKRNAGAAKHDEKHTPRRLHSAVQRHFRRISQAKGDLTPVLKAPKADKVIRASDKRHVEQHLR